MHSADPFKTKPQVSATRSKMGFASVLLALSLITIYSPVIGGDIYKSVDKDGNTVFTDRPSEGAENLSGDAPAKSARSEQDDNDNDNDEGEGEGEDGRYSEDSGSDGNVALTPEPTNPPKSANPLPTEPDEFLPVTVVEILSPIHDAILINPAGKTWVELQSYPTPMKKSGLTAELWMNGRMVTSGKRPMLSLPRLERGTYTLQIKLVNESGQLHLSSEISSIHVRVSP